MARKLDEIIKRVIWGATAAIAASLPAKTNPMLPPNFDNALNSYSTLTVGNKLERGEFTLYKSNSRVMINNLLHTSHSSHSSHASHSSHSSHYSSATTTSTTQQVSPPKQIVKDGTSEPVKSVPAQIQNKSNNDILIKLGSRSLSKGMKGTDVSDLQSLLIEKGYKELKITAVFDSATVKTIKEFQKSKKITETGKMDTWTLWLLQND